MTELEFDIIDELYFVSSFGQLATTLVVTDEELCRGLQALLKLGYVKCFYPDPDTEVDFDPATFSKNCQQYFFLATKAGLMAHNSR